METKINQLQILENELTRYQNQKAALELQPYPKDQEPSKQQLLKFYTEKITELTKRIHPTTKRIQNIEVTASIVSANQTG